jgi:hypothetical protein
VYTHVNRPVGGSSAAAALSDDARDSRARARDRHAGEGDQQGGAQPLGADAHGDCRGAGDGGVAHRRDGEHAGRDSSISQGHGSIDGKHHGHDCSHGGHNDEQRSHGGQSPQEESQAVALYRCV